MREINKEYVELEPQPLTLEELQNMINKPVWVETPGLREYSGSWRLVEGVDIERKALYTKNDFTCHDYGKLWVAYKTEPKGGKSK